MSDRIANEPVERPIAVVAAEVALTASVAYLVGLCLAIAASNPDAPGIELVLVLVGIGLVVGYGSWLFGGTGVLLAGISLPLVILSFDLVMVGSGFLDLGVGSDFLGPGLSGVLPALLALAASATALACGLLLPGPRRLRGAHGRRKPAAVSVSPTMSEGAVAERLRSVPAVTPEATEDQGVWFDDSTDEDRLLPLGPGADPQTDPDPDPGPDPMPPPDPMPAPDPMPEPDPEPLARENPDA